MSTTPNPSVPQLFDLSGRTALITGATGHLGSALAEALAEAGCRIILASRDMEKGRKAAAELPKVKWAEHSTVVIDQTDAASITAGFNQAAQIAGQLDILINNGHQALGADWRDVTP